MIFLVSALGTARKSTLLIKFLGYFPVPFFFFFCYSGAICTWNLAQHYTYSFMEQHPKFEDWTWLCSPVQSQFHFSHFSPWSSLTFSHDQHNFSDISFCKHQQICLPATVMLKWKTLWNSPFHLHHLCSQLSPTLTQHLERWQPAEVAWWIFFIVSLTVVGHRS